jgi:3-phosphoshikimate 1-carboxyvinyltransferase
MCQLGAIRRDEDGVVYMSGPTQGLQATDEILDCGNSGTTMRLVSGIVSGIAGVHNLIGDESLSKRPMDRVAIPLRQMGATVVGQGEAITAPLTITGTSELNGIDFTPPKASAQVKSAILFAGLNATGVTTVHEDVRTRATTEDMMRSAGIELESTSISSGRVVQLHRGRPKPAKWVIPGDPSQAAFFCVLGLIAPNSSIVIEDIEMAPERIGFVHVLRRMGGHLADVSIDGRGTFTASTSALSATSIHSSEIPSVDEVPILAVAAAAANGVTEFLDMGELRLKESDRFATSMALASALGCKVWSEGDDFFVEGLGSATRFANFSFDGGLDHRLVMSSAIAGTAGNGCVIENAETVASSYPGFFKDLESLQ